MTFTGALLSVGLGLDRGVVRNVLAGRASLGNDYVCTEAAMHLAV